MNDLISVGGICFVAVEPEKVTANNEANGAYGARPECAQQAETRDERENAGTGAAAREAGNGKRKYRPRGERSRKEQQRAASRSYRLRHLEQCRAWQAKYRQEHREELREYHREYYAEKRAHILNLHRAAYRRRKIKS